MRDIRTPEIPPYYYLSDCFLQLIMKVYQSKEHTIGNWPLLQYVQ